MQSCRDGSQYLPLQCWLSLCFIPYRARKKPHRSKKWHSAIANGVGGAGELEGSFNGQKLEFLIIAADCRYQLLWLP